MDQNTEDWLKLRHGKIGASDSNIIMGVSEYMNRADLLLQKTTAFEKLPPQKSNPIANLGHSVEALERPRFEFLQDKKFMPAIVTHPEIDWLMASFDGLTMDETESWECKMIGKQVFDDAVRSNVAPMKFYPQLQHQFLVNPKMKKTYLLLVQYEKKFMDKLIPETFKRHIIEVFRDAEYIETKLMPNLMKFREDVLANKDFTDLESLGDRSKKIKAEIDILAEQKTVIDDQIKKYLEPLGGKVQTQKWGFTYSQSTTQGIDYKKMIEDYKIDVEKYKKKPTVSYRLTVTEKKNP